MLLRKSISGAKKLFQKSLGSFKSLFSIGNYERLPKSSPQNLVLHTSYKDLDNLYTELAHQEYNWDSIEAADDHQSERKKMMNSNLKLQQKKENNKMEKTREVEESGERRSWLVEEKLKELEMLDKSNVDHILDIEEVLHYYSRLTCPAYLELVDKFFLDIYAEFFKPPLNNTTATARFNSSRLRINPRP